MPQIVDFFRIGFIFILIFNFSSYIQMLSMFIDKVIANTILSSMKFSSQNLRIFFIHSIDVLIQQLKVFEGLYILRLKSNNNKCKCIKHYELSYCSRKFKQTQMNTRSSKERSLGKKRQIPKKRQIKTEQKRGSNKKGKKEILQKRKIIKKAPKKQKSKQAQKHKQTKNQRINTVISNKNRNSRSNTTRKSKRKIVISSNRQFVSNMIASSKLKCQTKRKNTNKGSKSKPKTSKIPISKDEKLRSSTRIRTISQAKFKIRIPNLLRSSSRKKKEAKIPTRSNPVNRLSIQKTKKKEKAVEQQPKRLVRKDVKEDEDGDQNITTSQMLDESADRYKIILNRPKVIKEDKSKSILALQTEKKIQSSRSFILSVQEKPKQWQIKVSQLKKKGQTITINIQGITCSCINYRIHHTCENIQFLFDKVIRNPDLKQQILYRKYLGQNVFGQISEQLKIALGFHFSERKSLEEHPLPSACLICFEQLNSQASLSCEQCERKFHKACYQYFKFNRNHCPTCNKSSIKLQNDETLREMEKLTI